MTVQPTDKSGAPDADTTKGSADEVSSPAGGAIDDEGGVDEIARKPVIWTTIICVALAVAGHAVIWAAYALEWNKRGDVNVPWHPVVGISLSGVATVAFGGFYISSRRARVAIAASFLLTFLLALPFVVTIEDFALLTRGAAKELFDDFRNIVGLIVGFYFASEAAVSGLKVLRAGGDTKLADIQSADRDLAPPGTKSRTRRKPRGR